MTPLTPHELEALISAAAALVVAIAHYVDVLASREAGVELRSSSDFTAEYEARQRAAGTPE